MSAPGAPAVVGAAPAGPPAFGHDLETCVGCHACVIACANENHLAPGQFWRQVVTFNPARRPGLPTYHLSLACNHCLDAPCERGCPANAIARDPRTGAVLIDDGTCIGCRYCSMVCPYDAPRFDEAGGVMRKCTFCAHRLEEGLQPACVGGCPTGALTFESLDGGGPGSGAAGATGTKVDGFPETGIRPAIRFRPMRGRAPQPAPPGAIPAVALDLAARAADDGGAPPAAKIALSGEWTLALFTSLAIVLVAWFAAALAGGPPAPPAALLATGGAGLALSGLHLGRRARAWRAVLNWRRSWLSREVIAFPLFLGLAVPASLARPGSVAAAVPALAAGIACLVAIDRVYVAMTRTRRAPLDDHAALSSAVFIGAILAAAPWFVVLPAAAWRAAAFAGRARARRSGARHSGARHSGAGLTALAAARAVLGFAVPAALWLAAGRQAHAAMAAAVLAGEIADRLDFYDALAITTPRSAMADALRARIGAGIV